MKLKEGVKCAHNMIPAVLYVTLFVKKVMNVFLTVFFFTSQITLLLNRGQTLYIHCIYGNRFEIQYPKCELLGG